MPLRDHFRPPLRKKRHWESLHSAWANWITHRLNAKLLPQRYHAEPQVHLSVEVEVDVGTFEEEEPQAGAANGGVATVVWAPPKPPLVVPIDFADLDVFEVRVCDDEDAQTLVAAVELVSPANKDRPLHRRAFVAKCVGYLQQGVSVVVVDVVTERHHNMHRELAEFLELGDAPAGAIASDLYAVAYRTRGKGKRQRLEVWPAALAVGDILPVLPLWLTRDLSVPLDLEASYTDACDALRIHG
jgi:hypothetical protein